MDEKDQHGQELTIQETLPENLPEEGDVARQHDVMERAEPQPQYDSFMRVIRR